MDVDFRALHNLLDHLSPQIKELYWGVLNSKTHLQTWSHNYPSRRRFIAGEPAYYTKEEPKTGSMRRKSVWQLGMRSGKREKSLNKDHAALPGADSATLPQSIMCYLTSPCSLSLLMCLYTQSIRLPRRLDQVGQKQWGYLALLSTFQSTQRKVWTWNFIILGCVKLEI